MSYPIFGEDNSPIEQSNDGRLRLQSERLEQDDTLGWCVIDTADDHIELVTRDRIVAEAVIVGYDYRERLNREAG